QDDQYRKRGVAPPYQNVQANCDEQQRPKLENLPPHILIEHAQVYEQEDKASPYEQQRAEQRRTVRSPGAIVALGLRVRRRLGLGIPPAGRFALVRTRVWPACRAQFGGHVALLRLGGVARRAALNTRLLRSGVAVLFHLLPPLANGR